MRPLQLSFSGIRSYPGAVGPLDFTGKTLIAIIGDTGAGKSTILEAITLALYGNCTWTDREHKALMAEGTAQMTVDFTFTHDGQRWRVRRVYRLLREFCDGGYAGWRITRLRRRGKPARPYIWRLIILILLTLPSMAAEL
jgi:DNA repair exonuclease SbcCD ATPase subunit